MVYTEKHFGEKHFGQVGILNKLLLLYMQYTDCLGNQVISSDTFSKDFIKHQ